MDLIRVLLLIFVGYVACRFLTDQIDFFYHRDPVLEEIRNQLSVINPKFKDVELYEGDKSYTINKKKVYICLKDSDGRYYDRNMLTYVICHEFAHLVCDEVGHTDKFYAIFNDILKQATAIGAYDPSIPPLRDYCGHK
jgi:hypothetical protein